MEKFILVVNLVTILLTFTASPEGASILSNELSGIRQNIQGKGKPSKFEENDRSKTEENTGKEQREINELNSEGLIKELGGQGFKYIKNAENTAEGILGKGPQVINELTKGGLLPFKGNIEGESTNEGKNMGRGIFGNLERPLNFFKDGPLNIFKERPETYDLEGSGNYGGYPEKIKNFDYEKPENILAAEGLLPYHK